MIPGYRHAQCGQLRIKAAVNPVPLRLEQCGQLCAYRCYLGIDGGFSFIKVRLRLILVGRCRCRCRRRSGRDGAMMKPVVKQLFSVTTSLLIIGL